MEHFPWPLEYVIHEFLFKSHEKQKVRAEKGNLARSRNWSALKLSF